MEDIFEIHFRDEIPSKDRGLIISVSIRVEDLIGMCLSRQLGLREPVETRSFGRTSNTLSFNAKLNLFLDIKGITTEEAKILTNFSILRNKFAHLIDVQTVYDCMELDKDKVLKKFFEKHYAIKVSDYIYNSNTVDIMLPYFLDEVEMTCGAILERMFDKIGDEISVMAKIKKQEFLMKNLMDFETMSPEEISFVKRIVLKTKQQHTEYDFTEEVLALI